MSDTILTTLLYLSAIIAGGAFMCVAGCLFDEVFRVLTNAQIARRNNRA